MKIVKTRAFKDRLKGHKDTIIALHSPNGAEGGLLFSASKDGQIRAWDLVERQITCKLLLSRFPNETTVYEQNQQEEDAQKDKQKLIKDQLSAATFNEKNVYGGYEDGYVSSWNMKSGEILYTYDGHEGPITSMQFLNVRVLASSSLDGTVRLWDTSSGQCETVIKFGYPINQMRINGNKIHVLYNKNTIAEVDYDVWIQQNQQMLQLEKSLQFPNYHITTFLIQSDNLIIGTIENNIFIYSMNELIEFQNNQELQGDQRVYPDPPAKHIILGNQGWSLCMEILDKYLYVGTDERKIRVYNLKDWTQVEDFVGHEDGVTQVAFADNMLYTGSYDHSIRSWDLKEMYNRIRERAYMAREHLASKRYEEYLKALPKKKKKGGAKKKK